MDTEHIPNRVPNPWVPEKDPKVIAMLGKLLEESGELTSAVSRALIQGINESSSEGKANRLWIEEEIADVMTSIWLVIDLLGLNVTHIDERSEYKTKFIESWIEMLVNDSPKPNDSQS